MTETASDSEKTKMNEIENGIGLGPNIRPVKSKQRFYYLFHKYIWIFPLFIGLWVPLICVAPYISSIYYRHLEPLFPFVSDAGAHHPQAAYFAQMLDIMALCVVICTYARNKQIKFYLDDQRAAKNLEPNQEYRVRKLNFLTSMLGYAMAFGTFVIGNFRINENLVGHLVGVTFAFNGMMAYMVIMIIITKQMFRCEMETKPTSMRIITAFGFVGLIGCCVFSFVAICIVGFYKFADPSFRLNWKLDQPGAIWHILGTACEWIAILSVGPFYLCFSRRFYLFSKKYIE